MYEMMDPYTSRPVRVACAGDLKKNTIDRTTKLKTNTKWKESILMKYFIEKEDQHKTNQWPSVSFKCIQEEKS